MPRHEITVQASKKIKNAYWKMIYRCNNKSDSRYPTYGGRGIKVCARWQGRYGLSNFVSDMGEPEEWQSLDRIDNDKDYSPTNCQWLDKKLQTRKRTNSKYYEFRGRDMLLIDIAKETGINRLTLWGRINQQGMTAEEAVDTPVFSRSQGGRQPYKDGKTLSRLAHEKGMNHQTVFQRINAYGWSIEKALNTPVRRRG